MKTVSETAAQRLVHGLTGVSYKVDSSHIQSILSSTHCMSATHAHCGHGLKDINWVAMAIINVHKFNLQYMP